MNPSIPKTAGGWGAILYSLKMARRSGGLWPMLRALYSRNSCKTCALGMGGQKGGLKNERNSFPEVCNKSFQAQASDMKGVLHPDFFEQNETSSLIHWSPQQLELSGRLTYPILSESSDKSYRAISWEEAFDRITTKIDSTSPDRSYFYSSGRSSNEAGFLLQLFARIYGTNNLNNCSYYCHQASSVGLSKTLGTGTATIRLEDMDYTDLLFLIGANPSSNHPRFMKNLMQIRRRGGKVVVINPARERGLENFSVPSDFRSLLFGSEISSLYIQPHIGGDRALLQGIAKALLLIAQSNPNAIDTHFIDSATEHFETFKEDLLETPWNHLEYESGVSRKEMETLATEYAKAKNVVFAWAMGVTHHAHGVENVQMIVNLALMRGMVGRPHAGLLPLRGHSNVQGIGSVGVTPQLKTAVLENIESCYGISLPTQKGLDTMACMEAADKGTIDFAWHLGGNLFLSNPDSHFTQQAFSKIDFVLYLNTTLNSGHFRGRGRTTLILPVLARDEEPHPTTQESMFSYIRLSEGGPARYLGPKSEVNVIAQIAERVLSDRPVPWSELKNTHNIRQVLGTVVPGFEKMQEIDQTREEFHISGRSIYEPIFPTTNGKAQFSTFQRTSKPAGKTNIQFLLTTVRSEGQFNTVVYDQFDRYRGVNSRNVVFMSPDDIQTLGWKEDDRITVRNDTGEMKNLLLKRYLIKPGNLMMYYPEANILVPKILDKQSRTPAFKSILVEVEKE